MLPAIKLNPWNTWKDSSSQQRNESYKKNQMEILELKKYNNGKKILWKHLMEMTEWRVSELEDRAIQIIQSDNRETKDHSHGWVHTWSEFTLEMMYLDLMI